jgi:hypothetical protein
MQVVSYISSEQPEIARNAPDSFSHVRSEFSEDLMTLSVDVRCHQRIAQGLGLAQSTKITFE